MLGARALDANMFDIDRFVADCRDAQAQSPGGAAVREIVERAVSAPGEVERALGTPRWAGIGTIFRSPELTVLNIVWAPCMTLYPHDHRMWAVIGLYGGREDNVFYRRTKDGLAQAGAKELGIADTVFLGKTVIHSVANPSRQFTGALHVYGGDFFGVPRSEWDPETMRERSWDIETAKRVFEEANARLRAGGSGAG